MKQLLSNFVTLGIIFAVSLPVDYYLYFQIPTHGTFFWIGSACFDIFFSMITLGFLEAIYTQITKN